MDLTHVEDDLRAHFSGLETPRAPGGLVDAVRARHRHQRRQQAVVVGVGLAVALVFGSVPVLRGLVPDAPTAQDVAAPSSRPARGPSVLYDVPARGPLAEDAGWLAAMTAVPWQTTAMDTETPAPVDTHRVTWAGDVGGTRVAFVLGQADARVQGAWFTGPAGAAPAEMEQATGLQQLAGGMPLVFVDAPEGTGNGVLVVVGLPGDTAEYVAGTTVSADGQQQEVREPLPGADGVAAAELDGPLDVTDGTRVVVSRAGRTVDSMAYVSTDRADAVVQALVAELDDPRGLAPRVSAETVRSVASTGRRTYGTGLDGATPVLLAAGPTAGGGELALVGWTFGSGATVLAAAASETSADGSATSSLWTLDPQPAGVPLADQPVAVLLADDLALSGPSGAVTAEARDAGGALLATLPLASGSGTGSAGPDPATVRFLDAAGTVLAGVPVTRNDG